MTDYLSNMKQKVLVNVSESHCELMIGAHQGTILRPSRFFVYVNDLYSGFECHHAIVSYDDDTAVIPIGIQVLIDTSILGMKLVKNEYASTTAV